MNLDVSFVTALVVNDKNDILSFANSLATQLTYD